MDTVKLMVSVRRLADFMNAEDLQCDLVQPPSSPDAQIEVCDATLSWGDDEKHVLSDLSFSVKKGELVAVVGCVGAGKSSLLSSLLGELSLLSGEVRVGPSRALVTQQAWIQNMTLRDNILFGSVFDE